MPSLIQRLKKRKVVQWALGYLAGAFVVLQLMDALEGALGLSQQAQQGILALLACGLVVTGIIAWFHGDKGNQRVRLAEIITLGVALILGISASAMLWLGQGDQPEAGTSVEFASGSVLSPASGKGGTESGSTPDTDRTSMGGGGEGLTPGDTATGDEEQDRVHVLEPSSEAPGGVPPEDHRPAAGGPPPPALTPENPVLFAGDSVRLELDTDQPVYWTSSDHNVAMVTSDGLVLGVGPGSSRIAATVGGSEVSTRLTVRAVTASAVNISAVSPLRPGESVRPEVMVRMTNGQTRGRGGLQWSSGDTSVIEIGDRGTLTAVAPGSALITAERDGVTGSIEVMVDADPEPQLVSDDVLFSVLEGYRTALQGQDMAGVTSLYPGLSQEERGGWETLFRLGELSVEFSGMTLLEASPATATVEFEQVLSGGRIEENVTTFIATLISDGGGWRIQQLRAIDSGR